MIGPDADAPRDGNRGEDVLNPFRGERPRLCRRSRGTSSAYPGLFPSLGAFEPFTSPPGEREVKLPQHIDATRRESEAAGKTFVVSANIFFLSKASVSRRVSEGHLASGRATRDRRVHERGARWCNPAFLMRQETEADGKMFVVGEHLPYLWSLPSLGASARFTSRVGRRFVDGERGRALALARSGFSSRHVHCYNNNSQVF